MRDNFNTAMAILTGQNGEPNAADMQRTYALLLKAKGFPPALAVLSVLSAIGAQGTADKNAACDWFLQAAKSGFPPAVRGLAVLLLGVPETRAMGAGLLRRAAQAGDWTSLFLILREAGRGRFYVGKPGLTQMSARLSPDVPFRDAILTAIAALPDSINPLNPAPFKEQSCRNVLEQAVNSPASPGPRSLHDLPRVEAFSGALNPLECDYLIALSAPLMQPSKVVDADEAGPVVAGYRTSDGAVLLPAHMDFPAVCMMGSLSKMAEIAPEQGEFLSFLRYRPGQEYRPHHDYLLPDAADYSRVKTCGQRHATLLTYLNSGYEGGETVFPDLGITYKGEPGGALYFQNAEASGAPLPASLHAGAPVTSGEKWLMTLWCREKPFWPWMRGQL